MIPFICDYIELVDEDIEPEVIEPPRPQVPAEVHNTSKIDAEACMAATRALCKGQ